MYYEDSQDRGWYDTQQTCLNGHVITNYAVSQPDSKRDRCAMCGEATIMACPGCLAALRGYHHVPGVLHLGSSQADRCCDACGKPLPWTERSIAAVQEIVALSDSVPETDQEALQDIVRALMVPSGQTEVAALKLRKILMQLEDFERDAVMRVMKASASDSAKSALGLNDDPEPPVKRRR